MRQDERAETILDALAELAALHAAAAKAADRAWSILVEGDGSELKGGVCASCPERSSSLVEVVVDSTRFTVEWRGHRCNLGPSILFRLIQRLSRRPNRYYPYDLLMADVWGGRCSNAAVRSAVKRLRRALSDAGMGDLAEAIKGRGEYYGLILG